MKSARIVDLQRALDKRKASDAPLVKTLSFSNLPGFRDASIHLNSSAFAICGGTGVGKSAILSLLYSALNYDGLAAPRPAARLGTANAELSVSSKEKTFNSPLDLNDVELRTVFDEYCTLLDIDERTSTAFAFYRQDGFDSLLEGVTSYSLSPDVISTLSFICRKSYSSIEVFELENEDEVIPYFRVVEQGRSYDGSTMATGELSVIYIAWLLSYIPPNSVLLIEEPEAHLPPASHEAIFALICDGVLKAKSALIITTHSPVIAGFFSSKNLVMVQRNSGESVLPSTPQSKQRILSKLGLKPQRSAILFVEDRLAYIVCQEIIARAEFSITASIELVQSSGAGEINKTLTSLPSGVKSVLFFGILDGDMRDQASKWPCIEKIEFLPFRQSMEIELLQSIEEKRIEFSMSVSRSVDLIENAFDDVRGADEHDRFYNIAGLLGISYEALAVNGFKLWISQDGNQKAVESFISGLAKKLGVTLPTALN